MALRYLRRFGEPADETRLLALIPQLAMMKFSALR